MAISKQWREGVCRTCPHAFTLQQFHGCQYISRTLPSHKGTKPQDLSQMSECPDTPRRVRAEGRA